jgi:RNA polymerase sigma factor (sigma-70 family)
MFLCGNRPLLDAFRRGDRQALAQVYDHYYPSVVELASRGFTFESGGAAFRFRGAMGADLFDFVHDVFTAVFEERARLGYSGTSPYGAYLAQVTRNRIISRLRADQRMRLEAQEGAGGSLGEPAPSPEEELMARQSNDLVRAFLDRQDEAVRALARLRFGDDLSQDQVAEAMGLTRKKVRRLEDRLRRDLIKHLRRSGVRAPGGLLAIVGVLA